MSWEQTGKFMDDGRPIWSCAQCGRRIWGHRVGHHSCDGSPKPKSDRETPGSVKCATNSRGYCQGKMPNPSCGCSEPVYQCSKFDFCTINDVPGWFHGAKPQACVNCENRLHSE